MYTENTEDVNVKLAEAESEWPEYKANASLTAIPAYSVNTDHDLTHRDFVEDGVTSFKTFVAEGVAWLKSYLHTDVEERQRLKQHHVHMINEKTNEREPLAACRRKDNPKVCKSDFLRFFMVSKESSYFM